jgi:hypothetical protein
MYPVYVIRKENSESFFHAWLRHMRWLVTLSEFSNDVDITGTCSMSAVASRFSISYSYPAPF